MAALAPDEANERGTVHQLDVRDHPVQLSLDLEPMVCDPTLVAKSRRPAKFMQVVSWHDPPRDDESRTMAFWRETVGIGLQQRGPGALRILEESRFEKCLASRGNEAGGKLQGHKDDELASRGLQRTMRS